MADRFDLSIVTATCTRPAHLPHCLDQVHRQSLGNLRVEQIVVSDGPDDYARWQAVTAGARYFELPERRGQWGAAAKDAGIAEARGRYVCFWDDDNVYAPHAAVTLFAAAADVDVGIVQCGWRHRGRAARVVLPRQWTGTPRYGDIDTLNVCVRREVAATERWADGNPRSGEDYRWIARLLGRGVAWRFLPIVVGEHV